MSVTEKLRDKFLETCTTVHETVTNPTTEQKQNGIGMAAAFITTASSGYLMYRLGMEMSVPDAAHDPTTTILTASSSALAAAGILVMCDQRRNYQARG